MASYRSTSHLVFVALAVAALACSRGDRTYRSYRDAGAAEQVERAQVWAVPLPYKSGRRLRLVPGDRAVWAIERDEREVHFTKIEQDSAYRPGKVVHAGFGHVTDLEPLGEDFFLVEEVQDRRTTRVTILSRSDLSPRFSGLLDYSHRGFGSGQSGEERIGDHALLHQTFHWLDRGDGDSRFRIAFRLHVIDLVRGVATSHHFSSTTPAVIGEQYERCWHRRKAIDDCTYAFDAFDLPSGSRLLFSLVNPGGDSLDFEIDPKNPSSLPKLIASNDGPPPVVATRPKPPPALGTASSNAREKPEDEDPRFSLSGRKYRTRQFELLPGGPVMLLEDEEGSERLIVGVSRTATDMVLWRRPLPSARSAILFDEESDAIYFCEKTASGLAVRGVSAKDGTPVRGFPANFATDNGLWTDTRIEGTALDSSRGVVYLHDLKENRIVCARLE